MTDQARRRTVEYHVIGATQGMVARDVEAYLNRLAGEGWRVVASMAQGAWLVMERPA